MRREVSQFLSRLRRVISFCYNYFIKYNIIFICTYTQLVTADVEIGLYIHDVAEIESNMNLKRMKSHKLIFYGFTCFKSFHYCHNHRHKAL